MKNLDIILLLKNYTIYKNNAYYICIPAYPCNFYHIFMGFSNKDLNSLPESELLEEIRKISDSVNISYPNGIYVLPIINSKLYNEATTENDDRLYNKLLINIIQPITYNIYSLLSTQNMRVSQTIKMIKQNDQDSKLIGWLSIKLGNTFIKEITFNNNIKPIEPKEVIEITTYNDSDIFVNYDNKDESNKHEIYISDDLKPAISPGFGSLAFLIMMLSISSVFIGAMIYMILK